MKSGTITTSPVVFLLDFSEEMIPCVLPWLNDQEHMRYSRNSGRVHTPETQHDYMVSFDGAPHYYWGVHDVADGRLIGTATAYVDDDGVADIGLLMGKGYGGATLATMHTIITYLFINTEARKVTFGTDDNQAGVMKCCERLGMLCEGRRPEHVLINNKPSTIVLYGLLKRDWIGKWRT